MASAFPRNHFGAENVHPNELNHNDVLGKKHQSDQLKAAADGIKRSKKLVRRGSKTESDGVPAVKPSSLPLATITNTIAGRRVETEPNQLKNKVQAQNENENKIEIHEESMELDTSIASQEIVEAARSPAPLYSEYCQENCTYLYSLEMRHAPRWDYMNRQIEINSSMRSILVDWLISVAEEYQMQSETLHKSVAYIDRFLSKMSVAKYKFQLVGTAAFLVASKYEEIYPPTAKEMVHLTSDTYTIRHMLQMEQMMLKVLNYELGTPTAHCFLAEFCRKREETESEGLNNQSLTPVQPRTRWLAEFLSELSLLQGGSFLRYPSSCIAAAALKLAEYTLEDPVTPVKKPVTRSNRNSPCSVSGYSLQQLSPVMARQNAAFKDSPISPHRAVVEKFSSPKFASVALLKPKELLFDDL